MTIRTKTTWDDLEPIWTMDDDGTPIGDIEIRLPERGREDNNDGYYQI